MHKEPADPLYDQRVDIERVGPAPVRAATVKPRTEQLDFEEGSVEAALSFWWNTAVFLCVCAPGPHEREGWRHHRGRCSTLRVDIGLAGEKKGRPDSDDVISRRRRRRPMP
jgi:hypothetical protein